MYMYISVAVYIHGYIFFRGTFNGKSKSIIIICLILDSYNYTIV